MWQQQTVGEVAVPPSALQSRHLLIN